MAPIHTAARAYFRLNLSIPHTVFLLATEMAEPPLVSTSSNETSPHLPLPSPRTSAIVREIVMFYSVKPR